MIQVDTLRIRFRNMDNRELKKELVKVHTLTSLSVADEIARELITEELDLRSCEYMDWISKEVV